jgi:regulator of RNase E activity RraA
MTVAGLAFTISGAKSTEVKNEMTERAAMLDAIRPGSICVWETGGDDTSAQWGEVMTMASRRRGCRGAVIDGGVRDTSKVLALDFPVFCRYRTSNGMLGRFRLQAWDIPVQIGGVDISPGDVVFGDADGVIVVPRGIAHQVLVEAEQVKLKEIDIRQMITDGVSPQDVVRRGGYF